MKIRWFGHSCFYIVSANGTRILTDPCDPSVGYRLPKIEADIVTTSHDHYDHNYVQAVTGHYTRVNKPGAENVQGIAIKGVATFHDEEGGAKRGNNIMFNMTIDGLQVCHCGDLGHVLSPLQLRDLGPVDILLIPVGGFYTIDAKTAVKVCEQLHPRVIIPMHYKTEANDFPIESVGVFLNEQKSSASVGPEVEITAANINRLAGVLVMDYK